MCGKIISCRPRKVGQVEHAQTVCTRLFSVKEPGYEATIADATFLVAGEGSRELTQQATNLHVRPSFC